jgi:hypothetical protein
MVSRRRLQSLLLGLLGSGKTGLWGLRRMMKQPIPIVQPGTVVRENSAVETKALVARWLEAFGENRQGVNAKDFMWHIFSSARYPSLSGNNAIAEYAKQMAPEYVVLSNDRKTSFVTDLLPSTADMSDWYVFPGNLAWTMTFTHEDGWLGPYFARHRNFDKLNEANLAQLRKRAQAGAARANGW